MQFKAEFRGIKHACMCLLISIRRSLKFCQRYRNTLPIKEGQLSLSEGEGVHVP